MRANTVTRKLQMALIEGKFVTCRHNRSVWLVMLILHYRNSYDRTPAVQRRLRCKQVEHRQTPVKCEDILQPLFGIDRTQTIRGMNWTLIGKTTSPTLACNSQSIRRWGFRFDCLPLSRRSTRPCLPSIQGRQRWGPTQEMSPWDDGKTEGVGMEK